MFDKTDLETIYIIFESAKVRVDEDLGIDDQDNFYSVLSKVRGELDNND